MGLATGGAGSSPQRDGAHLGRCRRERYGTARSDCPWREPSSVEQPPEETLVFLLASCSATATDCSIWPGNCSGTQHRAGGASKPSAIWCISASRSATSMRGNEDGLRSLWGTARRLPRLRALGRGVLPGVEHFGPILHRLSRRHRQPPPYPPGDFAAWFEALSAAIGTHSTRGIMFLVSVES